MQYQVKQKMILMCEVIIARGIQLGLAKEDQEWVKLLNRLRCTCLGFAGAILAEDSECPTHAKGPKMCPDSHLAVKECPCDICRPSSPHTAL